MSHMIAWEGFSNSKQKRSGTTQLNMIHRGWPGLITVQHGVYRGTLVYTNEISF